MSDQQLISAIVWVVLALGSGLLGCLVWFALRVVAQLDRLEKLVVGEIHKLDLRLTKLEAWRDGRDGNGHL